MTKAVGKNFLATQGIFRLAKNPNVCPEIRRRDSLRLKVLLVNAAPSVMLAVRHFVKGMRPSDQGLGLGHGRLQ